MTGESSSMIIVCGVSLAVAVFFWIKKPFGIPFAVTGLLFLLVNVFAGVPIPVAFSGYSSGGFWTLVSAMFFGFALASTGLGKRIAYTLLVRLKNPSLPQLIALFFAVGIILSLLTPSMMVRVVIVTPIGLACADLLGFDRGSRERSILLISIFIAAVIPGNGWPNGSLSGPIFSGLFISLGMGDIVFSQWVQSALFPVFLTVFLTLFLGYLANKPKHKTLIDREKFQESFSYMGPITKPEIATGIILVGAFAMFVTREFHKIPDAAVCVSALILLFAFQVIKADNLGTGINWDIALFMGGGLGYGALFEYTGLSGFLVSKISPAVAPVANSSIGLFLILTVIVLFIWRFVDIACFIPTFAIMAALMPEFSRQFGIDPYVLIPIVCLAQGTFLMNYTNMFLLVAEKIMGDNSWDKKTLTRYAFVYCGCLLVAVAAALPYWHNLGLIPSI